MSIEWIFYSIVVYYILLISDTEPHLACSNGAYVLCLRYLHRIDHRASISYDNVGRKMNTPRFCQFLQLQQPQAARHHRQSAIYWHTTSWRSSSRPLVFSSSIRIYRSLPHNGTLAKRSRRPTDYHIPVMLTCCSVHHPHDKQRGRVKSSTGAI